MGKVIALNAPRMVDFDRPPDLVWKLRWRIITGSGLVIAAAWTPETRYPSLSLTLEEFAHTIGSVHVDGINLTTGDKMTFLSCPGDHFAALSYKGHHKFGSSHTIVSGIELRDRDNTTYLVLRDGTVYTEEAQAHVANND